MRREKTGGVLGSEAMTGNALAATTATLKNGSSATFARLLDQPQKVLTSRLQPSNC